MRVRIFQAGVEIIDEEDAVSTSDVIEDVVVRGKLNLSIPFTLWTDDEDGDNDIEFDVPAIPIVPRIDAAILAAIEKGGSLNMDSWHGKYNVSANPCGTTHCRAGWAIMLAGKVGFHLENMLGADAAGTLIYLASRPGEAVPDFYDHTIDAMADIRECAARQSGATP